jgi:guanine deaminase
LEASKVLADVVAALGQRGYVGKVNMDRNAPPALTEDTATSIKHTREFVDYVLAKENELLTPVITPRFVPSTSSSLMRALSEISREHSPKLPVQSHLSENCAEIEWVKSMHPECKSYADVYDHHGLLHDRSYMAHCVHCVSDERELLRTRGTAVIHCANSNFSLSSGVLNVRRLLDEGLTVGLGTDVSGGHSPSMLDAIRQAVVASKMVSIGHGTDPDGDDSRASKTRNYAPLSFAEAFHLATVGGADALGLGDKVGNFAVGKDFDALVVDPYVAGGPLDAPHDAVDARDALHAFQKFLFLGDDRNIESIFVAGKPVKRSTTPSL